MNAQPIATAPRDGTHILAADLNAQYPIWTAVHWFEDGWYLSVNMMEEYAAHGCGTLTHWLPQPHTELQSLPSSVGEAVTEKITEHDNYTFNITVTMRTRWIPHFLGMLTYMQKLGGWGSSRNVVFYADGDGDFRPKFDIPPHILKVWQPKEGLELKQCDLRICTGDKFFDAG